MKKSRGKIYHGVCLALASLFIVGCGGAVQTPSTEDDKDKIVEWSAGAPATGITVNNNVKETLFVCDGNVGTASSYVSAVGGDYGKWNYYTVELQATTDVTLRMHVDYHIGGGKVVEGVVDCNVTTTPQKISVVMYANADVLNISMYPFENGAFSGTVIMTDSRLTNELSGTVVLHCEYDETVPKPQPPTEDDDPNQDDNYNDEEGGKDEDGSSTPPSVEEEIVDDSTIPMQERLATAYSDYFKIGMTAGYERYNQYLPLEGHFNSFTCENEMKLYTIASNENTEFNYKDISTYDFSQADEMLTYMRKKGKKIRGHALIWHYEAPDWIMQCTDKALLLDMIDTYCYNVVKHFSDKFGDVIYAWDVVNEAVSDNYNGGKVEQAVKDVFGNNDDGCNEMRSSFYSVAGIDYITTAFKAARRADANVKLYYNDYNICTEKQKLRGVMNLVSQIIDAGAPIDGVGVQSHFKSTGSGVITDAENAINYLHRLAEIKNHPLDIQITELDVENRGTNDTALANFYGDLFAMYRRNSDKISSVTFWGVADDYSWLDNGPYNMAYPFLFDKNMNKKPAFDTVFNFH